MDAASGLCQGCLRTLDEIAAWGGMAAEGRRLVWAAIEHRAGGALTPALLHRKAQARP